MAFQLHHLPQSVYVRRSSGTRLHVGRVGVGRHPQFTGKKSPRSKDVADWIDAMKELLEDIEAGELYVIIDGMVIPAECEGAEFTGWHAKHDFATLPQLDAMRS